MSDEHEDNDDIFLGERTCGFREHDDKKNGTPSFGDDHRSETIGGGGVFFFGAQEEGAEMFSPKSIGRCDDDDDDKQRQQHRTKRTKRRQQSKKKRDDDGGRRDKKKHKRNRSHKRRVKGTTEKMLLLPPHETGDNEEEETLERLDFSQEVSFRSACASCLYDDHIDEENDVVTAARQKKTKEREHKMELAPETFNLVEEKLRQHGAVDAAAASYFGGAAADEPIDQRRRQEGFDVSSCDNMTDCSDCAHRRMLDEDVPAFAADSAIGIGSGVMESRRCSYCDNDDDDDGSSFPRPSRTRQVGGLKAVEGEDMGCPLPEREERPPPRLGAVVVEPLNGSGGGVGRYHGHDSRRAVAADDVDEEDEKDGIQIEMGNDGCVESLHPTVAAALVDDPGLMKGGGRVVFHDPLRYDDVAPSEGPPPIAEASTGVNRIPQDEEGKDDDDDEEEERRRRRRLLPDESAAGKVGPCLFHCRHRFCRFRCRRNTLLSTWHRCVIAFVSVVGVIVVMTVVMKGSGTTEGATEKDVASSDRTSSTTTTNTETKQARATAFRAHLIETIQNEMPTVSFSDSSSSSPSSRALNWMVANDSHAQTVLFDSIETDAGTNAIPSADYLLLQRFALTALWFSTNGDTTWDHDREGGLDPTVGVCDWSRSNFLCGPSSRYVLGIEILTDQHAVSGVLPAELGILTALRLMRLYDNIHMKGTFPSDFGRLVQLETLDLMNNSLGGTIPSQLGLLSELGYLSLRWSAFVGTIPPQLGQLGSHLEELLLNNNLLDGTLPSQLGQLTGLKTMSFSTNRLDGTIPTHLGHLMKLDILALHDNHLNGTIPSQVGRLTGLSVLYLHDNRLEGPLPPSLDDLSRLFKLYLYGNSGLTGTISRSLCSRVWDLRIDCHDRIECSCCLNRFGYPCRII